MPVERESREQVARRERGQLLAWFVACGAIASLLITLMPLSIDAPVESPAVERGQRLIEQSAPAGPPPPTPLGRAVEAPGNDVSWPSVG